MPNRPTNYDGRPFDYDGPFNDYAALNDGALHYDLSLNDHRLLDHLDAPVPTVAPSEIIVHEWSATVTIIV